MIGFFDLLLISFARLRGQRRLGDDAGATFSGIPAQDGAGIVRITIRKHITGLIIIESMFTYCYRPALRRLLVELISIM